MALNTNLYSGKEFEVYVACDNRSTGCGSFNTTAGEFQRLDVESAAPPTFAPVQEFEMRTGAGRVAQFQQIYSSTRRVVTEFSLSGRLTTNDLPILLENVCGKEATLGSNNSVLSIPTGWNCHSTGSSLITKTDVAGSDVDTPATATDYSRTLSVGFVSPSTGDGYKIHGCVITSLTLSADMNSAAGRFNYEATFQSAFQPVKGNMTTTGATAIGATKIFLPDMNNKLFSVYDASGESDGDIEPLISTVSVTLESPTSFIGAQGSNAEPELVAKQVPEFTITTSGSIKYDNETDLMLEAHRDTGGNSYGLSLLSDIALADGSFTDADSAAHFGFFFPKMKFTSVEVTSDDVSMVNYEAKVMDAGSDSVAEFVLDV